jgi:hypothetical protein
MGLQTRAQNGATHLVKAGLGAQLRANRNGAGLACAAEGIHEAHNVHELVKVWPSSGVTV